MENEDQGPPGSPGKLGQLGQPVSIFPLLKENTYFGKVNSDPSHMHEELELHSLARCRQLHFYEMGFSPAAQEHPTCTAHVSVATQGPGEPPESKGKQLPCQHTNVLRAAIPPASWAVLQHPPSCQV